MRTREDLIKSVPRNSVCAEIGVFEGEFSHFIKTTLQPSRLYLVDLFQGPMISGDKNGKNVKRIQLDQAYHALLGKYCTAPEVSLFRGRSELFLSLLPDAHLDFIYIDGDHRYEGCRVDLSLAREKVKRGGIIAGHDYTSQFPGVMQAVDEFCGHHGLSFDLTSEDGCPSYRIINS
jgi:Methyltransferase domain